MRQFHLFLEEHRVVPAKPSNDNQNHSLEQILFKGKGSK